MRVTFDPARLAAAMAVISKVANGRGGNIIASTVSVHLAADDGKVTLTGNNMESWVRLTIDADVEMSGQCLVSAERLTSLARSAPDGSQLALDATGTRAAVSVGRGLYHLALVPLDEFTIPTPDEAIVSWKAEASNFRSALKRASRFASSDTARVYLCGVFLDFENGKPQYVATNGHYVIHIEGEELSACGEVVGTMPEDGIIIDSRGTQLIEAIAPAAGVLTVSVGGGKCIIENEAGDLTLAVPLIDGTFPQWKRLFPSEPAPEVRIDPKLAAAMVARVGAFCGKRNNGAKITVSAGRMTATAVDADASEEASDEVPADFDGEDLETGLNVKYLADLLSLSEEGTMIISHIQPHGIVKFRPDQGDWVAGCSPYRV